MKSDDQDQEEEFQDQEIDETYNDEVEKPYNDKDKIAELEAEISRLEDKNLRSLAELENARRRFDKVQADTAKYVIGDFAKEVVVILDIFKKALQGLNETNSQKNQIDSFIEGIKLTEKELERVLEKFSIKRMDILDKQFDSNYHESLFTVKNPDKEDGTVVEIIEEGYTIHDRLLRSAKVGIIKN